MGSPRAGHTLKLEIVKKGRWKATVIIHAHSLPSHPSQVLLKQHPSMFITLNEVSRLCPPKRYTEVLIQGTLTMTQSIKSLCKCNQVRMCSCLHIHCDGILKRRDTETHKESTMADERNASTSQQMSNKTRTNHGRDSPLGVLSESITLPVTQGQSLSLQNHERIKFCCFKPSSCDISAYQYQETNTLSMLTYDSLPLHKLFIPSGMSLSPRWFLYTELLTLAHKSSLSSMMPPQSPKKHQSLYHILAQHHRLPVFLLRSSNCLYTQLSSFRIMK